MIGLGRNSSYEAAKRGEIPTLEFGGLKIVPRIPWLKQIGAEDAESGADRRYSRRSPSKAGGQRIRS